MIFAFTGKMQSGKSTACQMMQQFVDSPIRINFKDALVAEIKKNFPNVIKEILLEEGEAVHNADDLFLVKPPIFRALMQNYGTEVRRGDNPDYWVNKWEDTVMKAVRANRTILCDDVRFLNEAQRVRDLGGRIIRIVRTDAPNTANHSSEIEMDQITPDFTVGVKTGEHDQLEKQLKLIAENPGRFIASSAFML